MKRFKSGIKSNGILAAAVIIITFLLAASFTLDAVKSRCTDIVRIEATGEKNAESEGFGVGISQMKVGDELLDLTSDYGDWEYSGGSLVWGGYGDGAFELSVPAFETTEITFNSNIWAGVVQITVRGNTDTVDLYSTSMSSTYVYTVKSAPISELAARMRPVGLIMAAELAAIVLVCLILLVYVPVKCYPEDIEKQNLMRRLWKYVQARPVVFLRLAIIAISFAMMWHYAGEISLWVDDMSTIGFVAEGVSPKTTVERIMYEARYNPPLFYIVAYFWIRIMPYGTKYLKLLNIIFSCLGMWFCGTAAKKLRNDRAALLATVFASASMYLIDYAAYTFRCFGLEFFLCTLLILAYYRRQKEPNKLSSHIVFALMMALALYTNYLCGLVLAALGLYDFWLFIRKKIKFNCVWSYVGAGASFLPLILWAFRDMVESHVYFWPPVPDTGLLMETVLLIFSNSVLMLVLFAVTTVLLIGRESLASGDTGTKASDHTMWAMVIWIVFVIGFSYVFSRYINPNGSIFVARYFICVLPVVLVVPAVGLDWILSALCEGKSRAAKTVIITASLAACYFAAAYKELDSLETFPAFLNEPYEQAIDWIYTHDDATSDDTLVMMSGSEMGGLYYYATRGGERENLNFGELAEDNWSLYDTVYVAPLHTEFGQDVYHILEDHFVPVDQDQSLRITMYSRIDE